MEAETQSYSVNYAVIFPTSKEQYDGETGIDNSKLEMVSGYIQQPEHEKGQVKKLLKTWGKGNPTIFSLYNSFQITQTFGVETRITLSRNIKLN